MKTGESLEATPSVTVHSKPQPSSDIPSLSRHLPLKVAEVPREVIKNFHHTKRVGNYLLGRTLGEGSFAKVKEGLHVPTGEKVAIKVVDKKRAKDDNYVRKNMRREGKLLQMVQHPNIVRLYEVMETENSYYLVTELCKGGDFMDYICQKKRLDEREVRKYIRQIISAVDYLHRLGILHRDLKVENLLLDENRDIKLIDFGLSNSIKISSVHDGQRMEEFCVTQCGSPAYAAPELLGHKSYGPKVDVWSIGINMYAMLTGSLPFTVDPFNIKILHNKMLTGQMNPLPDHLSRECKDFLRRLLTPQPEKRMSMMDAMKHPWMADGRNKPMEQFPCPNKVRAEDINDDILRHMTDSYGYRMSDVIRHVTGNIPGPITAMYHLYLHRLNKYLIHQRVRTRISAVDAINAENNRLTIVLKEQPMSMFKRKIGVVYPPRYGPSDNVPDVVPSFGQPQHTRGTKLTHKEETLEPKIVQLEISPGVSVDVSEHKEPVKTSKNRPLLKPKQRETQQDADNIKASLLQTSARNSINVENVNQTGVTNKSIDAGGQRLTGKNDAACQQTVENRCQGAKVPIRKEHVIGMKNPRTILSELLPKQVHLRQRFQKRTVQPNNVPRVRKSVDKNNNNDKSTSPFVNLNKDNNFRSKKTTAASCNTKLSEDEVCKAQKHSCSPKAEIQHNQPVSPVATGSPHSDTERPKTGQSECPALRKHCNGTPTSSSFNETFKSTDYSNHARTNGFSQKGQRHLISVCHPPFTRANACKTVNFGDVKNQLSKRQLDPKAILMETCGVVVKDSQNKLKMNTPRTSVNSSIKRERAETESIQPYSPESSTGSKSSRSTTNNSDNSTSTKSSNVALPSISISPTIMRTN